jgi:hypothetical protein
VEQLRPVEGELRFDAREYVRTLFGAVLRAAKRHPAPSVNAGFVFPDETEQLVCGGATQARLRLRREC